MGKAPTMDAAAKSPHLTSYIPDIKFLKPTAKVYFEGSFKIILANRKSEYVPIKEFIATTAKTGVARGRIIL